MNSQILRKIYYQTCCYELEVFKPGNHSVYSKIKGMNELKFKYAAKISSHFLTDKKLSFGESVFLSAKKCKIALNSNYNLGIIILCAPILRVYSEGFKNFKQRLNSFLNSISEKDGQQIIKAIKLVEPGGIKNYKGSGNVFATNKLSFKEVMRIGSKWDRISKCYIENYKEILDFGIPILQSIKFKTTQEMATEILYINYLSNSLDSHLKRKFGKEKAQIVLNKAKNLRKKINILKNNRILLKDLDFYLKKFHLNPGTCADLTVTTLLIDKIRDIFKFSL
tara:strand:- start:51 stop:890 length:840 start_codon:yes stop_codon:yes gene_type:complete